MAIVFARLWTRIVYFWVSRIRHYFYGFGSGSFHQQAKKVRKTLISTIFLVLFNFYLLRLMYINTCTLKSNTYKQFEEIFFFFFWHTVLSATEENCRILTQIRKTVVRIRGSGSATTVTDPQHWALVQQRVKLHKVQ